MLIEQIVEFAFKGAWFPWPYIRVVQKKIFPNLTYHPRKLLGWW